MAVSYDRLKHLLIDKKLSNNDLIMNAGISANIITKIKYNKHISMESLEKICLYLNCEPNFVLQFFKENSDENN